MEGETSWVSHFIDDHKKEIVQFDSISEPDEENNPIYVDQILPDDILERILSSLPIATIFKATSVCKKWCNIITSPRFLWNFSNISSQKPWYYMFTSSDEPVGYAYDPVLKKWYYIGIPQIESSNWFITSSNGLICFMDNDTRTELYVCNPITKHCKRLEEPPGMKFMKFSDYHTLAISVNLKTRKYHVSIVKSKQVPEDFLQWEVSIHVYESETMTWFTPLTEILTGWRGGDESVICNGVLYFLIYSAGGIIENRHGLIGYSFTNRGLRGSLMKSFIAVPCALTCGRLMNLNEKLVMVGGIGRNDRLDVIKGIGIWCLNGKEWEEIARMPHKHFQGFGEIDDVFVSSGSDDLIYIQSYGAPALLLFHVKLKQWKWSLKCPVVKKFPLHVFTGFCFEPRLEIEP